MRVVGGRWYFLTLAPMILVFCEDVVSMGMDGTNQVPMKLMAYL